MSPSGKWVNRRIPEASQASVYVRTCVCSQVCVRGGQHAPYLKGWGAGLSSGGAWLSTQTPAPLPSEVSEMLPVTREGEGAPRGSDRSRAAGRVPCRAAGALGCVWDQAAPQVCGDRSQEVGGGCVGGVADHCGSFWRRQDHSLDLTQWGSCRAHPRASPPRPPRISIRPCWEQLGGLPSLGTLPRPLGPDPSPPRQRRGLCPSCLPTRAGLPRASAPAPPTHCYLGRTQIFLLLCLLLLLIPLPAGLAGRSFLESDLGRNPAFLQRPGRSSRHLQWPPPGPHANCFLATPGGCCAPQPLPHRARPLPTHLVFLLL